MYFEPTEDQGALRKSVRECARAELAPGHLGVYRAAGVEDLGGMPDADHPVE